MGTAKRPGGLYEVSGVEVDANGHPVKGSKVDEEIVVSVPVPSADGQGFEGTDGDTEEEAEARKAAAKSGVKRR
ncbi:MAG: hypothetical protein H0U59_03925 [Gemmatimonadaceae bacterium]|nr:hypothetical protein [Gemmatimonadaceae bacterium]